MAYILNKTPILCRSIFHKNIISGLINKNTFQSREHLTNKTNAWAEQKYKFNDNISNDYRLIYREQSVVNVLITAAYHAGWIILGGTIYLAGYLIYMKPPVQEKGLDLKEGYTMMPLTNLGRMLLLCLSFATCIIVIIGSKTIPFRIYHNSAEKIYKAVFVNRILGKKQIETFGEGTVVPVLRRKFLGEVLFNINGRFVILDKECFPVPYVREQMIRKTE